MSLRSNPAQDAAVAVTRLGLGARPGELELARSDPRGWLSAQITPVGADLPHAASGQPLPSAQEDYQAFLASHAAEKAAGADQDARKDARQPLIDAIDGEVLARARLGATTSAPFRERWALFWGNHFTVSTAKGEELNATAAAFEREAVRPHVFGRFEDLLVASSRHPAMLMYLDQQNSVGPNSPSGLKHPSAGLNENLGREIMELHALGADAGYSQADVTEFARALTGWSMGGGGGSVEQQGLFLYKPQVHESGGRRVFGANYAPGEEAQARMILADFAASPHTSRHLARKIATHFVADDPPTGLVARLDRAYRSSNGDLAVLAEALVAAPESWTPDALKLKTPYELLISSYRAVGFVPADARKEVFGPLGSLGQRPFFAPQPNGWPDVAADWAAPDAVVRRIGWARSFAGGHAPADPVQVAEAALGVRLSADTAAAIRRAESRPEALTLLLMSPEFQRR
ncbi:DUF1800 family protein [Caulobacter sp. S45]|uniref:DUF1800 domain-containing protein n=1 Tax=Caulobacter sp. S45 TaxID=1641861 RepID=UPI0015753964|nr:DUF1800 domain-containing protein [Caulobacter sp. S45]